MFWGRFCWGPVAADWIFPPRPWDMFFFSFCVDSSCGRGNGAPNKIKCGCLRFRAGVFQFAPVPISSPHPGSWPSLALGEVVRKASLSVHFLCGFCADFSCGFSRKLFEDCCWQGDRRESNKKKSPQNPPRTHPRISASQPSLGLKKSQVHTCVHVV